MEHSNVIDGELIVSMSKLLPKTSKISTPLYIDDAGTYRNSGHWKRIKFKQNNSVVDMRDWAPMNFDGEIMSKQNDIELKPWQIKEIRNFVHNNKYILEKLCEVDNLEFSDFLQVMIQGGQPATQQQIDNQIAAVDQLIDEQ